MKSAGEQIWNFINVYACFGQLGFGENFGGKMACLGGLSLRGVNFPGLRPVGILWKTGHWNKNHQNRKWRLGGGRSDVHYFIFIGGVVSPIWVKQPPCWPLAFFDGHFGGEGVGSKKRAPKTHQKQTPGRTRTLKQKTINYLFRPNRTSGQKPGGNVDT